MAAMNVTTEILSAVEFRGRFSGVTDVAFHDDRYLRLGVSLADGGEGIAFLDTQAAELVAVQTTAETTCRNGVRVPNIWFQLDEGIATLAGDAVHVWPDIHSKAFSTFPVANPEHHASDPVVLTDEFMRRPQVLRIEPMSNGSATALCSDSFYVRGGRYLATLVFRNGAFHWSGSYRQIEEAEVQGGWTDRAFNLHDTPLIHGVCDHGDRVSCVTRGGTATMLNHGPTFQTNLLVRFRQLRPAAPLERRFGLRGLFARQPQTPDGPTFVFEDVTVRPEGTVVFDRRTGGHAVKLRGKNRMEFFDPSDERPFATLALTPKRSLGKLKHDKVGLAVRDDLLVVCGQDGLNVCRMDMPSAIRREATDVAKEPGR